MRHLLISCASLVIFGISSAFAAPSSAPLKLIYSDGVVGEVTWLLGPRVLDESSLHVEWKNSDGSPHTQPVDFAVNIEMPGMHHRNPLPDSPRPAGSGYDVLGIYFLMEGDWRVNFNRIDVNGSSEELRSLELTLTGQGFVCRGQ